MEECRAPPAGRGRLAHRCVCVCVCVRWVVRGWAECRAVRFTGLPTTGKGRSPRMRDCTYPGLPIVRDRDEGGGVCSAPAAVLCITSSLRWRRKERREEKRREERPGQTARLDSRVVVSTRQRLLCRSTSPPLGHRPQPHGQDLHRCTSTRHANTPPKSGRFCRHLRQGAAWLGGRHHSHGKGLLSACCCIDDNQFRVQYTAL